MQRNCGDNLTLTILGASHDSQIGMTLTGIPAGLAVDMQQLQGFLDRRAPGKGAFSTARKEADAVRFLSGVADGITNGEPIHAVIENQNVQKTDYQDIKYIPRPGHADFTAWTKYGLDFDMSGGGPFSGRMTAPLCIAGGLCKQWLEAMGIRIGGHIAEIYSIADRRFDPMNPELDGVQTDFPVLERSCGEQMQQAILSAKAQGDSVGGSIECAVTGLPAGMGDGLFGGLESKLSQWVYAIPAVKGVEFGLGFAVASYVGSQANDPFVLVNGQIATASNHCGGILGGITTGMPVLFRVAVKPTPSIALPQKSVNMKTLEEVTLQIHGRHDPCILPRAVPVVEAAAAIAIYDLLLGGR